MPQSLAKNYIHIIFSTKYREPIITPAIEHRLHNYLGGVCRALECTPIQIGGVEDHVHILCLLSRKIALIKLVEEVKSHSSKWIKTTGANFRNFYWQNGYGAFSVSPPHVDTIIRYIQRQREHHNTHDFQTELRSFLNRYDMEYDERYVWD